ncbi:MAG: DUF3372 domain-containing protein, partial [Anaerolineae bacterium]
MSRRKRFHWQILTLSILFLALFSYAALAAPTSVTIAGSLQSALGCPGDWDPACAVTHLTDMGNDVWRGEFTIPTGSWEYKAALNDSWTESYPAANKALTVGADTAVRFYYDDKTKAVVDSVNDFVAVAAGSFQSAIGCASDWDPACVRSLLTDADGDGVYSFVTTAVPAGSYEFKVAMDEGWITSYPAANVPFSVLNDGEQV